LQWGGITVQVHVLERVQIVSVTDIATQTPPTLPNQQQPTAQNPIQPTHLLPEVAVVIPMIVPMVQLNLAAKRLRLLPPPQIHRYQPIPLPPHLLTSHPRVITMGWIVLT